jgi:methylenetetrahydrofolate dehydrogenase (NADP+)/methenyltetrahydrofolate cyclohydrolase
MTTILDGQAIAQQIRGEVKTGVTELAADGRRAPGLAAVLVGGDPASQIYVNSKVKACEEAGMVSQAHRLPEETTEDELMALVDQLNEDDTIDGILVQLPLPKHLPDRAVIRRISPEKDVDGFHPVSVGRLWLDEPGFVSATPAGILELLRRCQIPLAGRHAVVVGRSNTVGKPMAALLLRENCTVTLCHSKTRDLPAETRRADILVAAIGRPGMITAEHVQPGAVVVDVGINRLTDPVQVERFFAGNPGKLRTFADKGAVLIGDVDYDRVHPLASAITPVPGGVGPLTIAMLLSNTLTAARRRQGLAEP